MKEMEKLLELARERNAARYAWFRQLLTLAAGGLALLVGLAPDAGEQGAARWFLASAWTLLGLGITSGAGATYAEVSLAKRLADLFQKQLLQDLDHRAAENPTKKPIVAVPHMFYRICQRVMVLSLLGAVVSLVSFAVMRTLGL